MYTYMYIHGLRKYYLHVNRNIQPQGLEKYLKRKIHIYTHTQSHTAPRLRKIVVYEGYIQICTCIGHEHNDATHNDAEQLTSQNHENAGN